MMMLGREVSLTVEHPALSEDEPHTDYAENLRSQIQKAQDRAQLCLGKSMRRQKKNYDRKAYGPCISENEFVWLSNPAKRKGVCHKLKLKWEGPYLVLRKLSDVVFRIQRSKGVKPRVVHADRLKPYVGEPIKPWNTPSRVVPVEEPEALEVVEESERSRDDLTVTGTVLDDTDVGSSHDSNGPAHAPVNVPPKSPVGNKRFPKRTHRLPVRYR